MKKIIFLIIINIGFIVNLNASEYHLFYMNKDVGLVKDLDNINKSYITVVPTSFFAKSFIKFKKQFVFYTPNQKPQLDDTEYKEDRSYLLNILRKVQKNKRNFYGTWSDNRKISIIWTCTTKCTWKIIDKNQDIENNGIISFFDNGQIKEFTDDQNSFLIKYI